MNVLQACASGERVFPFSRARGGRYVHGSEQDALTFWYSYRRDGVILFSLHRSDVNGGDEGPVNSSSPLERRFILGPSASLIP